MKHNLICILSLVTAICMLGGCSQGGVPNSFNIVDTSNASIQNSSRPANSSASLYPSFSESVFSQSQNSFFPPSESTSAGGSSVTSLSVSSSKNTEASSAESVHSFSNSLTSSERSSSLESSSASSKNPESSVYPVSESSSAEKSSSSSDTPPKTEDPHIGTNSYKALNYKEVKGVWISYIEISEMASSSASVFRKSIGAVYDNCKALGINTVYVHARSHGDAYYSSELFPYTKYVSGGFDALEIMVEEAHKRGLSFQAWINPLRVCSASDTSRENGYPIGNWLGGGTRAVKVGSYYYLNPAYDDVIKLIADGAAEITANYDVDGLHIDDYFYPTTDASFDSAAFKESGYSTISDFRFANCDKMVSTLYKAVKSANPSAVFGVSCQGSIENNYSSMYADVKKWCAGSGYLDYIMPQIYYGFNNSVQPFEKCVKRWDELAASGNIPLIVGLSVSKIGLEDTWAGAGKSEWVTDSDILRRQFLESCEQQYYGGICLYSYRSIFSPESSVKSKVEDEITALKAVMN